MAFNVPSFSTSNISFGPAVMYMKTFTDPSSTNTPTADIGAITEDGITIEMSAEKRYIAQGNPRLNTFGFTQVQNVSLSVTSIEWDFPNFRHALGAAVLTSTTTFGFGGDPACVEVAIQVLHKMPNSTTITINIWKAVSESGFSLPFGQDEHQFEFKFNALYSAVDWGGSAITGDQNLIQILRTW